MLSLTAALTGIQYAVLKGLNDFRTSATPILDFIWSYSAEKIRSYWEHSNTEDSITTMEYFVVN